MAFIAGAGVTNVDLIYNGIKKLPGVGEEVYTNDFSMCLGGGIPGTLVNLSRLGIETRLTTELGSDIFSEFAKNEYKKAGVTPLNIYTGTKTPVNITSAVILPRDRSFITYSKGALSSKPDALEAFYNSAHGAKLCYMEYGRYFDVYKKLKSEGTLMVFDTGWDDSLSLEKYGDYIELADYYTPNKKEAMKLTGTSDPFDAARALQEYLKYPVVKIDSGGCIGIENGEVFTVNACDEFKCVDSTGAGDAFLAGFMYGVFHGYAFKDCIRLGNITGGKAVTAAGALTAYFTESELLEYMNR